MSSYCAIILHVTGNHFNHFKKDFRKEIFEFEYNTENKAIDMYRLPPDPN